MGRAGSTATDYMIGTAWREIKVAKAGLRNSLMPEGLFYGARQYQPTLSKKLSALEGYLKNIFMDPEEPARIVGIINWRSVSACPLFMPVSRPAFLDYNGPVPDTDVIAGLILMDYEPLLSSLLRDVKKEWASILGVKGDGSPFPLQFSDAEICQQEEDGDLWAQGVELMGAFLNDTGCFKHWDGKVSDVDYEQSKKQLDEGVQRQRSLDREARNQEERGQWLEALPFVD
ncbi:hypothetical protein ASPVEDRAFT_28436 [Aspergillus versicolor CBS 583.65]|uniref:Uncharacterized protein n=1 Tax=Aspergillus versicolor CBS 583.65 TaxID=1036611 RepID=A0A1L9PJT9_ASPVE|nr:uncharacterized protein ASPVEDRAFT_28436 [Aspergillus versicolor CBS 583.65]OJJ01797.1 hypothetical protein ASPVEDRAFT_28436 [Aspergillus versicolor CBS 583.65]